MSDTNIGQCVGKGMRAGIGKKITYLFEKVCISFCSKIAVPSVESFLDILINYPETEKEKVKIIEEGLSENKEEQQVYENPSKQEVIVHKKAKNPKLIWKKKSDFLIIFPFATERKSLSFFLECVPEILKLKNTKIVILGNILIPQNWQRKVISAGFLSDHAVDDLFSQADALIYVPKKECHSYTVLRALQHSLPFVYSDTGWLKGKGIKELALKELSCEELILAIKKCIHSNKQYRNETELIYQKLIKKYNSEKMAEQYKKLFEDLN